MPTGDRVGNLNSFRLEQSDLLDSSSHAKQTHTNGGEPHEHSQALEELLNNNNGTSTTLTQPMKSNGQGTANSINLVQNMIKNRYKVLDESMDGTGAALLNEGIVLKEMENFF